MAASEDTLPYVDKSSRGFNFATTPKYFILCQLNFVVKGSPKYLGWIKFSRSRIFRNNV